MKNRMLKINPVRFFKKNWVEMVPYFILIVLVAIMGIMNPGTLSPRWLANKMDAGLILVFAAIGQTLVLITGGFDLSVGGIICITNSFAAVFMGDTTLGILLCVLECILIGAAIGFINGFAIVKTGMQPFIVTLATQSACYGIALMILRVDGGSVPAAFVSTVMKRFGNLPLSLIIMVVLLLAWFWFKRTNFGLQIYSVGSNEDAARLNGIRTEQVKICTYLFSGLFGALSGIYRTAQVSSGSPTAGSSYVMLSIAAAVVGGTSLSGGKGGMVGTIVGVFVLKSIADLLVFLQVSSYWTSLVQGVLMIIAVALSAFGYLHRKKG